MTSYPTQITLSDPFKTPLHVIVREFSNTVKQFENKPYHINRLVKTLGKKVHVKFCTSQRQALATLIEFACNPDSVIFRKIRNMLGMTKTKIDGVQSKINTLVVLVCCCNMETMMVGMREALSFKHFSQPYLAKIAGCCPQTIYRHLKSFAVAGVMKQLSRNEKIDDGLYIYHTSMKVIFERMFNILGVGKDQLGEDRAFFTRKRQAEAEAKKPQPTPEPVKQENPTLDDDVLIVTCDEFKTDDQILQEIRVRVHDEFLRAGNANLIREMLEEADKRFKIYKNNK